MLAQLTAAELGDTDFDEVRVLEGGSNA